MGHSRSFHHSPLSFSTLMNASTRANANDSGVAAELDQLPPLLRERVRPMIARPVAAEGELVLVWLHHAVRGHENPAVDVGIEMAHRLDRPLLIYQGLAGPHPFNADRHHAFILEGARDAHAELNERGIQTAFYLPSDPSLPSPLPLLAARAALVITEDFPAPPFPRWMRRLGDRALGPLWAVDCCCLVPMQRQPRRFERAFELRRHNAEAYRERVPRVWRNLEPAPEPYLGPIPFEPFDLQSADLNAAIADCQIDHSLPPVAHTRGGSERGYRRWEAFRRAGLQRYHQRRNDAAEAWSLGVSRLSPYLHHGHVSPFRIAREAWELGGEGAEKFLDELLVWRELAHNLCFFADDLECLSVLPEWAQSTLAAHAADPRAQLIDLDRLGRGRSGDRLWDLAQTSLLVHGELHNNLRMTWAKAIPSWRPTPEAALKTLIELNHRYALDGSDPNSYGGLLWTLGLFDRPFEPEQAVTGRLRTRPTAAHARRLDLTRYARKVSRPATSEPLRIAIIGAGLSGLSAARTLADQRHRVTVFEKSRGCGGRAATRRLQLVGTDSVGLDHGAQYFTARDPRFLRRVEAWSEAGLVVPWAGRLGAFDGHCFAPVGGAQTRWVAVPGMSALGRALAEGLDLRPRTRIVPPRRIGKEWLISDDQGVQLGRFDRVIISAPAPQAAELLADAPPVAAQAACVDYAPCWALMLVLDGQTGLPFDGVFVNQGPLRWAARDSAKPGRRSLPNRECWVLHATADWSRAHLEADPSVVAEALLEAFSGLIDGPLPELLVSRTHRWRYALLDEPLEDGCLWDARLGIGACGDWCHGARIEGAWLSGEALAGRLLLSIGC